MAQGALHHRGIVIVGGSTGLGLSAALACVKAGANVVVIGRSGNSLDRALTQLGDSAQAMEGDAIDSATAPAAIELAIQHFGRFDGLYHVAGGSGRKFGDGPLHKVTDDAIEKTLDLNLNSLIRSNRAAVQQLRKQGRGGVILNMGSVLGSSPAADFFATHIYAAAKSAIVGFTKSCAAYYATENIRFNVIAPALVDTPMATRAAQDPEIMNYIRTKQPLEGGRIGSACDLDAAAVFLLSDASRYVTGQVLAVDGGWSVSEGQIGASEERP